MQQRSTVSSCARIGLTTALTRYQPRRYRSLWRKNCMRLSGNTKPIIFGFLLGLRPIEIIIQEFQPVAEFQPAAAVQSSEPAENRIYVQPRWVDGGYGVEVLQPAYWTDPKRATQ